VDDASTDETPLAAEHLCAQFPHIVEYVRNEVNRKQTYSKNRGKAMATTKYVYFGDDDSLLMPGSTTALLETMNRCRADIVGSAALYCPRGEAPEVRYEEYLRGPCDDAPENYVDLRRLRFHLDQRPLVPLELPVTHAQFLIRREWSQRFDFDIGYKGNCFREETDFLLRVHSAGAKIFLDGRAVQINLPPSLSRGGARSSRRVRYEWEALRNTARFLRKHSKYYRMRLDVSPYWSLLWYLRDRAVAAMKKVVR
jgi:glycosyltransferase involved in cell wall biosynthesis